MPDGAVVNSPAEPVVFTVDAPDGPATVTIAPAGPLAATVTIAPGTS